ncbi:hypothetical protein SCLCIDRAFT_375394 [Scleroderma citrinum Foug A]|uniref:Uncharacterized protein n=1 Tax=Scleroderma citrinum Foug A TaxID=1036808 RepID=A0A0C3DED6_9AGAM|nr:hypothetical protein SCLCIDRAFT_375394 [Scleroderma citrinum Foug A]
MVVGLAARLTSRMRKPIDQHWNLEINIFIQECWKTWYMVYLQRRFSNVYTSLTY